VGFQLYPRAINNLGWVTGFAFNGGDHHRTFVWRPDTGQSVLLPLPSGVIGMEGHDINDLGHVVGSMEVPGTGLGRVPFIWDGQQTHAIAMPAGAINGYAYAVNNSDEVVGEFDAGTGAHAFHWRDGIFTDIGALIPVSSKARDINELGEIVGEGIYPGYFPRAFRISGGAFEWLPEPPGFVQTFATSLNNNGLIVGAARITSFGAWRGLIWSSGSVEVLEPPPGRLWSGMTYVNDAGQALGSYSNGGGFDTITIIWQAGWIQTVSDFVTPPVPGFHGGPLNAYGQFAGLGPSGIIFVQPHWLAGDLNGDCHVHLNDLLLLLSNFGSPQGSFPRGDVDLDGDVDLSDLTVLLSHWGEKP
jgi:probable HAF family extracellular repeat protein